MPLKTLMKIDRPWARTQVGKAAWAATLTVATTATQATPAADLRVGWWIGGEVPFDDARARVGRDDGR